MKNQKSEGRNQKGTNTADAIHEVIAQNPVVPNESRNQQQPTYTEGEKMQKETPDYPGGSLAERSRRFALEVVRFYTSLPHGAVAYCLGKQLLRSATSVGAHLSEGRRSRSRAEITSKTEVALQELEESVYWMKLMRDVDIGANQNLETMLREANELTAILVAGIKRLKQPASRPEHAPAGLF